jgi:adenylosuccinate synthase
MKGYALAVVGAQYGSEGKGAIVNHIADQFDIHVRVGAPNAGHTFWHKGRKAVMQSIPCGWKNPKAKLVLGRGALINPEILNREIKMLKEEWGQDLHNRLFIDTKAGCLDPRFHELEGGVHGEAHKRIGSTGEGVGPARMARMNRKADEFQLMESVAEKWGLEEYLQFNTPQMLDHLMRSGSHVLIEGTQGSGLSLIHGPWPFCTSTDTNAAQMLADCGIAPSWLQRVIIVARTYPIRVAGNSGPLKGELSWEELSQKLGRKVEERTTVTKKVRRVGVWDDELIEQAVTLNAPTSIALTFMDYLDPQVYGQRHLSELCERFIEYVERRFGTPVSMAGTGGEDVVIDLKGI